MNSSKRKVNTNKMNISFVFLTMFCYVMVRRFLGKAGYPQIGRGSDTEESFVAFLLLISMCVSLYLYTLKKAPSNQFKVTYMIVISLLVLIIFLPMGYSKYVVEYSAAGSMFFYVLLCIIFIAWNLARVIYPDPPKKRW